MNECITGWLSTAAMVGRTEVSESALGLEFPLTGKSRKFCVESLEESLLFEEVLVLLGNWKVDSWGEFEEKPKLYEVVAAGAGPGVDGREDD